MWLEVGETEDSLAEAACEELTVVVIIEGEMSEVFGIADMPTITIWA